MSLRIIHLKNGIFQRKDYRSRHYNSIKPTQNVPNSYNSFLIKYRASQSYKKQAQKLSIKHSYYIYYTLH